MRDAQTATLHLLLCLGLAASSLEAQVTARIGTRTAAHVRAGLAYGSLDRKAIAASTSIANGYRLTATASTKIPSGARSGTARSHLTVTRPSGTVILRLDQFATPRWSGGYTAFAVARHHRLLPTLTSPTPVAGRLQPTIQDSARGFSSTGSTVDLGDDGKVDLTTGSKTLDVVIGPRGLAIELAGTATTALGTATSTLTVTFTPGQSPYRTTRKTRLENRYPGTRFPLTRPSPAPRLRRCRRRCEDRRDERSASERVSPGDGRRRETPTRWTCKTRSPRVGDGDGDGGPDGTSS